MSTIDELIEKLNARAKRQADRGMSGLGYYGNGDAALDTQTSAALSTLQEQKRKLEEALKAFAEAAREVEDRGCTLPENFSMNVRGPDKRIIFTLSVKSSALHSARALLSGGGE